MVGFGFCILFLFYIQLFRSLQLSTGVLIGQLCSCHGADVYSDMKECILSGIRDNIDRDVSSANEELLHKLSSRHTGDEECVILYYYRVYRRSGNIHC